MKNITIRSVPAGLHHDLVKRAKVNNRSLQGELITILQLALYPGPAKALKVKP